MLGAPAPTLLISCRARSRPASPHPCDDAHALSRAGYFTTASYNRRGPLRYLMDRSLRLLTPILVFELLIQPATFAVAQVRVRMTPSQGAAVRRLASLNLSIESCGSGRRPMNRISSTVVCFVPDQAPMHASPLLQGPNSPPGLQAASNVFLWYFTVKYTTFVSNAMVSRRPAPSSPHSMM